ncbi:8701_t:CDS:2 [Entrophospora sp. SA101]|nr:7935_t:CDS:2 [Entrophospora sp. SA101]CAJ0627989.1 8701_t:CDS:2 [Entrophospora sp. SA101]
MLSYITQTFNYIVKAISYLDDSKDLFKAGDLVEFRKVIKYMKTPKLTTQKRPRAKAISSGKYAKNKGEKEIEKIESEINQD